MQILERLSQSSDVICYILSCFVYFRFEKYKSNGNPMYAFVGYMTVYNYYAYPEKIRPRIRYFTLPAENIGIMYILNHV